MTSEKQHARVDVDKEASDLFRLLLAAAKVMPGLAAFSVEMLLTAMEQLVNVPRPTRLLAGGVRNLSEIEEDGGRWKVLPFRLPGAEGFDGFFCFDPASGCCLARSIPEYRYGIEDHSSGNILFILPFYPLFLPLRYLAEKWYAPRERKWGMSRHARNFYRGIKGDLDEQTRKDVLRCLKNPVFQVD